MLRDLSLRLLQIGLDLFQSRIRYAERLDFRTGYWRRLRVGLGGSVALCLELLESPNFCVQRRDLGIQFLFALGALGGF